MHIHSGVSNGGHRAARSAAEIQSHVTGRRSSSVLRSGRSSPDASRCGVTQMNPASQEKRGTRPRGWISLRTMLCQFAAGTLLAGIVVLYSGVSSIQYEGPPAHISAILRALSHLIPCTFEFASATTRNVALAHEAWTLVWTANFLVGILHFAYLSQTMSAGLLPISWTGLSERFPAMVDPERGAIADEEVEVH